MVDASTPRYGSKTYLVYWPFCNSVREGRSAKGMTVMTVRRAVAYMLSGGSGLVPRALIVFLTLCLLVGLVYRAVLGLTDSLPAARVTGAALGAVWGYAFLFYLRDMKEWSNPPAGPSRLTKWKEKSNHPEDEC